MSRGDSGGRYEWAIPAAERRYAEYLVERAAEEEL